MLLRLRGEKDMTLKDKATMGPLDKFVKYSTPLHRFISVEIASACDIACGMHRASSHYC